MIIAWGNLCHPTKELMARFACSIIELSACYIKTLVSWIEHLNLPNSYVPVNFAPNFTICSSGIPSLTLLSFWVLNIAKLLVEIRLQVIVCSSHKLQCVSSYTWWVIPYITFNCIKWIDIYIVREAVNSEEVLLLLLYLLCPWLPYYPVIFSLSPTLLSLLISPSPSCTNLCLCYVCSFGLVNLFS